MPNCFQLIRKGETKPSVLARIDEEICAVMDEPVHPKFWCHGWYDVIGFLISLGRKFGPEFRAEIEKDYRPEMLKIYDHLAEHYTSDAWYESKV